MLFAKLRAMRIHVPAWAVVWLLPQKPYGVRIRHPDGRVSRCRVRRAPVQPVKGETLWLATPPPGARFDLLRGDKAVIALLPPNIGVRFTTHYRRNENWP